MNIRERIINILIYHKWALLVSLFVGFVVILPQVMTVVSLGEKYDGIYIMKMDAEEHYLARMQEFLDFRSLNNPFLFEDRGLAPSASFTISESILSLPLVFGLGSVTNINLFYKFILPALLFFGFYLLMFRLTNDKFWSIAFATTTILGYASLTFGGIKDIIFFNFENFPANMYGRPINPAFSSIFFVIYLHLVLSVYRKLDNKLLVVMASVFGLSFYIYFYSFTYFIAINAVCFVILFINKKTKEAYGVAYATIFGIAVGVFAIINMVKLLLHENYVYLAPISNIVNSRQPIFSFLGVGTLFIFIIYLFFKWKSRQNDEYFLITLILTAFIAINQQVVTGISIQEGHYHWYFNTPVYLMVLFWVGYKLLKSGNRILYFAIPAFFIFISFFVSVFGQVSFYKDWAPQVFEQQRYANVFRWLNQNATKTDVVFSNNELSLKIPAYTITNPYWNYFTLAYLTPLERTKNALFMYLKINDVKPSDINHESYFHPPVVNKPETKNNKGYEYEEVNILLRDYMTGIYPEGMKEMYESFYNKSWKDVLGIYKIDYLIWDKKINPNWSFEKSLFKEVFVGDDLIVYKKIQYEKN